MCMNDDMISDIVFVCAPRGILMIECQCLCKGMLLVELPFQRG
jgi:hypothetical protein